MSKLDSTPGCSAPDCPWDAPGWPERPRRRRPRWGIAFHKDHHANDEHDVDHGTNDNHDDVLDRSRTDDYFDDPGTGRVCQRARRTDVPFAELPAGCTDHGGG